jgi:lipopolysaccharide/colanic/teichoic acid biosynthesis glycosyltransferase
MRTRRGQGHVGPRVITEDIFRGILARERKRSDRSHRAFGLLLVGATDGRGADSASVWETALHALVAAKRDIDIAGWFEWPCSVGVIVPALRAADLSSACAQLDARFRRELAKRLDGKTVDRFSIRLHVYGEPPTAGEKEPWPADPLFYPDLRRRPARRAIDDTLKRGLDIVTSLTLLMVLAPLLALIAALVKLSSRGTVFYRQVRIGQMMKPFTILKFRTMYSNADHRLHHDFVSSFIKARGQGHEAGQAGLFKLTNDPRVTPVGRFLRSTSLDELPQLWNALRGDMSLVGPRPPLPYELEQYEPWHRRRVLEAKPGITGLWQVAGRSRTTFDDMVRLDLRYARTRSFWTDIKILLATPAAVISGKGAC